MRHSLSKSFFSRVWCSGVFLGHGRGLNMSLVRLESLGLWAGVSLKSLACFQQLALWLGVGLSLSGLLLLSSQALASPLATGGESTLELAKINVSAQSAQVASSQNSLNLSADSTPSQSAFEPVFPDENQDIVSDVISSSIRQSSEQAKKESSTENSDNSEHATEQWKASVESQSNQAVESNEGDDSAETDSAESEVYALPQLTLFIEADLRAVSLPAMPPITRPSSSAHFLTKAEQRFCFLYQSSLVEDARLVNRQCLGTDQIYNSNLGLDKYIFVLKALALFRAKFEIGLTEAEVDEVLHIPAIKQQAQHQFAKLQQAKTIAQGSELSQEQDLNCFLLRSMALGMRELINVGYSLDEANKIIALFNNQCAGRLSHGERLLTQLENLNIPELIQPIMDGAIYSVTDYIKPKSYLFPFEGTTEQRYPEILEAQQHLTKLGYLHAPLSGVLDEFTFVAMTDFENDQGLIQTGQVSFSNLMRLRLYTVGYKPEFLIPNLTSAPASSNNSSSESR